MPQAGLAACGAARAQTLRNTCTKHFNTVDLPICWDTSYGQVTPASVEDSEAHQAVWNRAFIIGYGMLQMVTTVVKVQQLMLRRVKRDVESQALMYQVKASLGHPRHVASHDITSQSEFAEEEWQIFL